ncbi:MAG: hypothetical protein O2905_05485 [Proteobacteria bacterium]|nr:hypothetical protein [Pseudomonadota bacterium]
MALKLMIVAGGVALFVAMVWDRFTGHRSARVVLGLVAVLVVGILVLSQLIAAGYGPGGQ